MAKKMYMSPIILTSGIGTGDDPTIVFGGSQGTSGDISAYTFDPAIDPDDIEMFWASYDETDLEGMDTDHDLFISAEEFETWLDSIGGW